MPASLDSLSFDIFHTIVCCLDISDYVHLSRVCKRIHSLSQNELTARTCLERSIASTSKERYTGLDPSGPSHRKQIGQIYARREALRTAQPFSASIVAHATQFTYKQGILCYLSNDQIRLLDIHGCSREEAVIQVASIVQLSQKSLAPVGANAPATEILLLGCTKDYLVCRSELTETGESWLLVVDVRPSEDKPQPQHSPQNRHLLRHRLNSTTKLFVRHNGSHLYYGTHSALGSSDHHEWLIQGFDLSTGLPVTEKPLQLVDFVGSELGSTTCFEIHDGSFYAVSNQTSFETEEVDWTSYYHYVQFRVDDKSPDLHARKIWRRQHVEGPINDSWTELSLQKDERTNELLLVECRREWRDGGSVNIRTYYTQPLTLTSGEEIPVSFELPANDPLTKTLDDSSKPNYEPAKKRLRRYCHPEYPAQSSPAQDFILAKTKFRAYNPASQSFIDLVNDPAPKLGSSRLRDRLRLRIASRTQKSPLIPDPGKPDDFFLLRPKELDENDVPLDGSEEDFHDTNISVWPPNDAPTELFDLLCPGGGRAGQIEAVADERSLVYIAEPYAAASSGQQGAIVLINFDPMWRHDGLKRLASCPGPSGPRQSTVEMRVGYDIPCHTATHGRKRSFSTSASNGDGDRPPEHPSPNKRLETVAGAASSPCYSSSSSSCAASSSSSSSSSMSKSQLQQQRRLIRKDKAMYTLINQGYWLR